MGRRARRRRQSASLAVTAALTAVPVFSRGIAAADSSSGPAVAGSTDATSKAALQASGQRVVLEMGAQGPLVASAQHRLNDVLPLTHLAVDGIYGPLTRGAVVDFQRRNGLAPTGAIDARTWAIMFKAPVVVMGQSTDAGSGGTSSSGSVTSGTAGSSDANGSTGSAAGTAGGSVVAGATRVDVSGPTAGSSAAGSSAAGASRDVGTAGSTASGASGAGSSGSGAGSSGSGSGQSLAVVSPSAPAPQSSTYVLTNGVALPLPRGYLTNGYVDQGVDYSAPGGTPLYAMGDGVIIGEGISGFGPNAPILQITSGPLKGLEVYYGHSGPDTVRVGQHVHAGQQISEVGYGIVGISTGPHLEIGFYPPGPNGAGSRMLALINSLLGQHPGGRAWGARAYSTLECRRIRHRRVCWVVQASPARASADTAYVANTTSSSTSSGSSAPVSAAVDSSTPSGSGSSGSAGGSSSAAGGGAAEAASTTSDTQSNVGSNLSSIGSDTSGSSASSDTSGSSASSDSSSGSTDSSAAPPTSSIGSDQAPAAGGSDSGSSTPATSTPIGPAKSTPAPTTSTPAPASSSHAPADSTPVASTPPDTGGGGGGSQGDATSPGTHASPSTSGGGTGDTPTTSGGSTGDTAGTSAGTGGTHSDQTATTGSSSSAADAGSGGSSSTAAGGASSSSTAGAGSSTGAAGAGGSGSSSGN